MYVVAASTDTPSFCYRRQFVTGGKLFRGAYCIEGLFVLKGLVVLRDIFSWGTSVLGSLVTRGLMVWWLLTEGFYLGLLT